MLKRLIENRDCEYPGYLGKSYFDYFIEKGWAKYITQDRRYQVTAKGMEEYHNRIKELEAAGLSPNPINYSKVIVSSIFGLISLYCALLWFGVTLPRPDWLSGGKEEPFICIIAAVLSIVASLLRW